MSESEPEVPLVPSALVTLGEVELEPELEALLDESSTSNSPRISLVPAAFPAFRGEGERTLRDRLLAAALYLTVAYTIFAIFGYYYPIPPNGLALESVIARVFLGAGVVLLLLSPAKLSHNQLRSLEYLYFAALVIIVMVAQYWVCSIHIAERDAPHFIAFEKNGLLNLLVVMVLYGVLIPNKPVVTARVVMTMAIGPLFVLLLLRAQVSGLNFSEDLMIASNQMAIANSLYLLMGAALAIYTSYILSGLRHDLNQARRLGQYHLGEKLGEGGMGEVFLAEHLLLKRPCALKRIKSEVSTNPIAVARFEREVQAAAMLTHPNTIEIYDYGHADDGTFYYVMEYLPGLSLGQFVRKFGPVPPARAVYLLRQVCGSLAEAHRLGLIHRDLKPANIFVANLGGKYDIAKVLDFGLVKLTATPGAPQLTADYTVSGTPMYMSPEQATGSRFIDARSDIYALGAILYYMLTGHPPFEGGSANELMMAHARDPVVPPSQRAPHLPPDLEAIVMRCLAKHAADRFPTTRALAHELSHCTCAPDWDDEKAEKWWTEIAAREQEARDITESTVLAQIN
jgi:serine/threonine-protein kinase